MEDGNFVTLIRRWRDMWNNLLHDHLQSMRLVAGPGVRIQRLASGTVISAERSSGVSPAAVQTGEAGSGGAFAVEVYNSGTDESPEMKVKLFNSESESGTAGQVTAGSFSQNISDQEWPLSGTSAQYVYMSMTYTPATSQYTIVFNLASSVPSAASVREYILPVAELSYSQSAGWKVSQLRPEKFGNITITGRWV